MDAKTEPQQPNNAVSSGSSLSIAEQSGTSTIEPNGKPSISKHKDTNFSVDKQETDVKSVNADGYLCDGAGDANAIILYHGTL